MGEVTIFSRNDELGFFSELLKKEKPQFLAIYGRRRIGKTFIVSEFFKDKGCYFEMTGSQKANTSDQIENFEIAWELSFEKLEERPKTWKDVFHTITKAFLDRPTAEKKILFIDELPWFCSQRSNFLAQLDHFWNRHLSRIPNILVVICGSAASWMIANVIHQKGGLYNRITSTLHLEPLSLGSTQEFLRQLNVNFNPEQVIDLYMAIGGVPKYLMTAKPGFSAAQTIQALFFKDTREAAKEYKLLFKSLFNKSERHEKVIMLLAQHKYGLTFSEIVKKAKLPVGGSTTQLLEELIESDFLQFLPSYQKNKKAGVYRLIDEYCLFFNYWKLKNLVLGDDYWLKQQQTSSYATWSGYAFENVVLKNKTNLLHSLGISGITCTLSTWQNENAQIDLLIERADRVIHLCEMKFSRQPLKINRKLIVDLQNKKTEFQKVNNKQIFTTLVVNQPPANANEFAGQIDKIVVVNKWL